MAAYLQVDSLATLALSLQLQRPSELRGRLLEAGPPTAVLTTPHLQPCQDPTEGFAWADVQGVHVWELDLFGQSVSNCTLQVPVGGQLRLSSSARGGRLQNVRFDGAHLRFVELLVYSIGSIERSGFVLLKQWRYSSVLLVLDFVFGPCSRVHDL